MRDDMTILEAKELKRNLQAQIAGLITEFEGLTGLEVTGLEVRLPISILGPRMFCLQTRLPI